MEKLPISVIIPTKNAENCINECLASIRQNNPAEIIVVDGNSKDRTLEIARNYTEKIFSDGGKGTSAAHQLGAERSTQEYIVYVDADVIVPPGTLNTMLNEFITSGCTWIDAKLLLKKCSTYWERAAAEHAKIILSKLGYHHLMATLLKRSIVLEYGFNSSISIAGDDTDFYLRLKKGGEKFVTSTASVYTFARPDMRSYIKQRYRNGKGKANFIRKNPFNPLVWPPLTMTYNIGFSIIKFRLYLIPYFLLGGVVETVAMVQGLFELLFVPSG
jgi:glycosyltransferase involved in cell wall biosynthesis